MTAETIDYMEAATPADLREPRFGIACEVRKVRRLIHYLAAAAFYPHSVSVEGEGYVLTPDERAALCEPFEWDAYTTLRFSREQGAGADYAGDLFGVLLVTGNGEDIISDWSIGDGLTDAAYFGRAVEGFIDGDEKREV